MARILVVEDNDLMGELYVDALQKDEYAVTLAATKKEALEAMRSKHFDLLLVDKNLTGEEGDESGLAFLSIARAEGITTPAIVASGLPTPESVDIAKDLASLFIAKPLPPKLLIQVVRMGLGEIGKDILKRLGFVYVMTSTDDVQHKYLVPLESRECTFLVEVASFIEPDAPSGQKNTVCASSQLGCRERCGFCETAVSVPREYVRNLTYQEMKDLILLAKLLHGFQQAQITFAGQGEPFRNREVLNVIRDADKDDVFRITTTFPPDADGVSLRESTQYVRELAKLKNVIQLQVSLHFPYPLRKKFMPGTRDTDIIKLLEALKTYARKTGKKVHLNWVLFQGLNDSREMIQSLGTLLRSYATYFVLRLSQANERGIFQRLSNEETAELKEILENEFGLEVKTFTSIGIEYELGCGMLSSKIGRGSEGGRS